MRKWLERVRRSCRRDSLVVDAFPARAARAAGPRAAVIDALESRLLFAVPAGFAETKVVGNLVNPTHMTFAPDGRLFVSEKSGKLRIIKNGNLLSTPFLTVPVSTLGERGLQGVAFDPDFASNGHLYVFYTATSPNVHNRVSRFTANGDTAVEGSQKVLLDLNNPSAAYNHNGGRCTSGPTASSTSRSATTPTPPTPSR